MYNENIHWKLTNEFLPVKNRLNSENMPNEYYIKINKFNIHIDHYRVENPKGKVILFHGVGGNGRLLSFIAISLRKAGYEIIAPDLPPYGFSDEYKSVIYDDWLDIGENIILNYQNLDVPLYIFGLSAGGMLAYHLTSKLDNINGLIITCLLDLSDDQILSGLIKNYSILKFILPFLKFLKTFNIKIPLKYIVNMDKISNNKKLVDILLSDKKSSGNSLSLSFLYSMINMEIPNPENFEKCPVLLVHPENDKWTDIKLSTKFFNRICFPKQLKILKGAGHFPIEEKGLEELEHYCINFLKEYD